VTDLITADTWPPPARICPWARARRCSRRGNRPCAASHERARTGEQGL